MPGDWSSFDAGGGPVGTFGVGTYRLVVECDGVRGISLFLPDESSAVRWFVNGQPLADTKALLDDVAGGQRAVQSAIAALAPYGERADTLRAAASFIVRRSN